MLHLQESTHLLIFANPVFEIHYYRRRRRINKSMKIQMNIPTRTSMVMKESMVMRESISRRSMKKSIASMMKRRVQVMLSVREDPTRRTYRPWKMRNIRNIQKWSLRGSLIFSVREKLNLYDFACVKNVG